MWCVGDRHPIVWGDIRPSGDGYALTVWWPRQQGVPDVPHRVEVVGGGAAHVVVTSMHRAEHLARERADDLIRGIHERVVGACRAALLAELAELDAQSSSASQSRTDAGSSSDAKRGGAESTTEASG